MKLHTLLKTAMDDLRKAEQEPDVEIDMGIWYEGKDDRTDKCIVCMAGAVLMNKIGKDNIAAMTPGGFARLGILTAEEANSLVAINDLRTGEVDEAALSLELVRWHSSEIDVYASRNRTITEYADDPEQFWEDITKLHADLVEADL